MHFHQNYQHTGNCVILTGQKNIGKKLWYIAHLDTISYLVQAKQHSRYPLVPFCHHLIQNGKRLAVAYRFVHSNSRYEIIARGCLESEDFHPFFCPENRDANLKPGDRIVFSTYLPGRSSAGNFSAHVDNAGAVAALLAAAPVLSAAKVEAVLVFPDEEEGPPGSGNQMIRRGSARILNLLPVPELVIVSDVQQSGGDGPPNIPDAVRGTKLGEGAILSEFSSLARGAVTPPHLYVLAVEFVGALREVGVKIQLSDNSYTSRSDDVSVMLKTPNVLLLGFPGFNRHFDLGEPMANLYDLVNLAKAMVYFAALRGAASTDLETFRGASGMIDIVTIGWLTIDDIVLPNAICHPQVIGGGALYSAIGARIWLDNVGIHSVTGEKYLPTVKNEMRQSGLDVTGLNSISGNGLELWVLHETETDKQQVPKLTSSTAKEMDSGRRPLPEAYRGSRGFHIAPQSPASSIANIKHLSSFATRPIITLDILADPYIDANEYLDLSFLQYLAAFIPSREEVHRIWHPTNLSDWMQEQAAPTIDASR